MEPTLLLQTRRVAALLLFSAALSFSQEAASGRTTFFSSKGMEYKSIPDTNIVFESPNKNLIMSQQTASLVDAGGVDILFSNDGFGLGGFYRHQYTDELFGTLSIGFSEAKDANEVEQVTIYGQTFVPGKINRFLFIPLHVGVQYRLFADDILDNFRPYINAAVGPSLVYSTPYDREFFNSIRYGQTHYTAGGYVGFGAYFGSDRGTLTGVNIRYYYEYFQQGIDSMENNDGTIEKKKDFGGFFITLNFGSMF